MENATILIVEDDERLLHTLAEWVTHAGYVPIATDSSNQALEKAAGESVDLVVTDWRLPGRDGLWLAERLLDQNPDRPVLLTTGYPDLDNVRRALAVGIFGYLVKPVGMGEFVAELERALKHRRLILENRKYQRDLKGMVEERTTDLLQANEQLRQEIDGRRKVLEDLRQSQVRLQSLFETMAEGVILIAPGGTILQANPTAQRMAGMEYGPVEGCPIDSLRWKLHRPDGTPMPPAEMPAAVTLREARPVRDAVVGLADAHGNLSWFNTNATVLRDRDGEMDGVVLTLADITELRQAEDRHRRHLALERVHRAVLEMERVEDFEQVARTMAEELRGLGHSFQGLSVNVIDEQRGVFTVYGILPQETHIPDLRIGDFPALETLVDHWRRGEVWERPREEDFDEVLGPSYRPDVFIDVPFTQGTLGVGVASGLGRNESMVETLREFCPVLSLGYQRSRDLAEQRAAHQAVQEREAFISKVVESSLNGIYIYDLAARTNVYINPQYTRLTGWTREELAAMDSDRFFGLFHPDDQAKVAAHMEQVIQAQDGEILELEYRFRTASDKWIWCLSWDAVFERDEQGEVQRFIGTSLDITERKRMDREMIGLERLRALSEMAAGVSHNLNNMLSTVLGPAQILLRQSTDPVVQREAAEILKSGRRARDLVHRLSQAVRGQPAVALGPVAINTLVLQAVQAARPRWHDQAAAQGISIEVVTELEAVQDVRGNAADLHDVLLNLLFNAIDALPEGGAVIIGTRTVADAAELTVRDTGIGMDEETRRRVFEPFFTTKMDVGSGLGLSSVHGAVTRAGGQIEVESSPGTGTLFTLCLPLWTEPPAPVMEEAPEERPARAARILVVEDDERTGQLLSRLLSTLYEVDAVLTGREALADFAPGRYDVALIDLALPGMPGDKVARSLVQIDPAVVPVLVTGSDLAPDDPRRSAFDFSLRKPLDDLDRIEDVVARAIELHDSRAGGPEMS